MKSLILIIKYSAIVFLVLMLFACRKDLSQHEDISIKSEDFVDKQVRDWFKEYYKDDEYITPKELHLYNPSDVASSDETRRNYKFKWDKGTTHYKGDSVIVEVPLEDPSGKYLIKDDTGEVLFGNTATKLLIIKKSSGTRSVFMTIIADDKSNANTLLKDITLLKKKRTFNGTVLYQTMDGAFLGGFKYLKGKPVEKLSFSKANRNKVNDKGERIKLNEAAGCGTIWVDIWRGTGHSPDGPFYNWRLINSYPLHIDCSYESPFHDYTSGDSYYTNGADGPPNPCGAPIVYSNVSSTIPCDGGGGGGGGEVIDGSEEITLEPELPSRKLCPTTFNFVQTVPADADGPGLKEASLSGLAITLFSTSSPWYGFITGDNGMTSTIIRLEISVPGQTSALYAQQKSAEAVNWAMDKIISDGYNSFKSLVIGGTFNHRFATLVQARLLTNIPGARAYSQLSGRTEPKGPEFCN